MAVRRRVRLPGPTSIRMRSCIPLSEIAKRVIPKYTSKAERSFKEYFLKKELYIGNVFMDERSPLKMKGLSEFISKYRNIIHAAGK